MTLFQVPQIVSGSYLQDSSPDLPGERYQFYFATEKKWLGENDLPKGLSLTRWVSQDSAPRGEGERQVPEVRSSGYVRSYKGGRTRCPGGV